MRKSITTKIGLAYNAGRVGVLRLCIIEIETRIFVKNYKMETVIINADKKADMSLLLALAKKMGMNTRTLTRAEVEDWHLAKKIEAGMKTADVSRKEIMKALGK